MAEPKYDLEKLLKEGSGIRVTNGDVETSLEQQRAGARRALFWSMLTVHNQLSRRNETEVALEKGVSTVKKEEAKAIAVERLESFRKGEKAPDNDDPAFPGFSIIHDVDWPFNYGGGQNGMWTINQSSYDSIVACRLAGIAVRHRCSMPDFERSLGGSELGKDKSLSAYIRVNGDPALREGLQKFLVDICDGAEFEPFGPLPDGLTYIEKVSEMLHLGNVEYGVANDILFVGKAMPQSV
jgi:hypothetical protein